MNYHHFWLMDRIGTLACGRGERMGGDTYIFAVTDGENYMEFKTKSMVQEDSVSILWEWKVNGRLEFLHVLDDPKYGEIEWYAEYGNGWWDSNVPEGV